MGHHRQHSVVVLLVLVVEEDQLRPEVGLLSGTENLPWVRGGEGGGERERITSLCPSMMEVAMCILINTHLWDVDSRPEQLQMLPHL